jgi:hypothetical protein
VRMKYKFALLRILLLGMLVFLLSCIQPTGPRLSGDDSSENTGTSTSTNSGPGENPFLQEGATQTFTNLTLASTFIDSFYLRGNDVNDYVAITSNGTSMCLVAYYPSSVDNKLLVLSAQQSFFNNFSLGSLEYYLKMFPSNKTLNQTYCLTAALTNQLQLKYGSNQIAYSLDELCPNCTQSLTSEPLELYNDAGTFISQIPINKLKIEIATTGSSIPSQQFCSQDSTCSALNYDCCLNGQCVNDGSVKSGVDLTNPSFLAAALEVQNNPASFQNYPEFYYICPSSTPNDDPNDDQLDPQVQAQLRLGKLEDLYNCLNPIYENDETSICTLEYDQPSATVTANGGTFNFSAGIDDLNFSTVNPLVNNSCGSGCNDSINNIYSLNFNGDILYKECTTANTALAEVLSGNRNDDTTSAQEVQLKTAATSSNPQVDYLKVGFKVDGSCERLSANFAQCTKYYVQGQTSCPIRPSDHSAGDNFFQIPSYADMTYNVIVKVGDDIIPPSATTWTKGPGNAVTFNQTVFPNQVVQITYFVTGANIDAVMNSKDLAQAEVNTICNCGSDDKCNLTTKTELQGNQEVVIDYECFYPQPNLPEPPLNEVVYVSSKSVPMRFFDKFGVAYDELDSNTPLQELNEFYYESGDPVKPSNIDDNGNPEYIGPNEVYGNMNNLIDPDDSNSQTTINATNAIPPVKITVKKGRAYNLYVDQGGYSNCSLCGVDYYSNLKRLFPETFLTKGGGLTPDPVETDPFSTLSDDRRDDTLFGRACFVPLTMIPWSHVAQNDVQNQRQLRLQTQHAYFANGYNRDWYGFDYGSLIASYDGVNWFSVGNRRRTTAKSNRLFLATNGYFADLTNSNSYKVVVTEVVDFGLDDSDVLNDTESDGAQCQKYHFCDSDKDCITQLGYDYQCVNIANVTTTWPRFDSSANEIPDDFVATKLVNLLDGKANGQTKRCVYRGRGAPCQDDIYGPNASGATSYAGTGVIGQHSCAPNYHCSDITSNRFNNTIARAGRDPSNQNANTCSSNDASNNDCTDTVGHSARVIGRPYNYFGSDSLNANVQSQLTSLNVGGMCQPGRSASLGSLSLSSMNGSSSSEADPLLGIGPTQDTTQSDSFYAACPTYDDDGNYLMNQAAFSSVAASNVPYRNFSASQNISTKLLDIADFAGLQIFGDDSSIFEDIAYRKNTCLRAPGAACFSDLDCAPSKRLTDEISLLIDTTGLNMVEAELDFWKEDLVCSAPQFKRQPFSIQPNINNTQFPEQNYDLKENKCCRELSKEVTIYTEYYLDATSPNNRSVAGIGITSDNSQRYSRMNTVADLIGSKTTDTMQANYNRLTVPQADANQASIAGQVDVDFQFNTFDAAASRTCCSSHWIRNFDETDNGGGHFWTPSKFQQVDIAGFRCLSWQPDGPDNFSNQNKNFECNPGFWQTTECEVRNIGPGDEQTYMNWLGKLDLLGIPNVMIENENTYNDIACKVDSSQDAPATDTPIPGTINDNTTVEYTEGGISYLSAGDMNNFDSSLRKIFDEKKVTCCTPTGVDNLPSNIQDEDCCTGRRFQGRCCLEDFTDITLYLNRYVSSEANGLADNLFDPKSGYLLNPTDTIALARAKNICCSGTAAYGAAIGQLFVPGAETDPNALTRRFIYSNSEIDNNTQTGNLVDLYEAGLKWTNHLYCVPSGAQGVTTIDVTPASN